MSNAQGGRGDGSDEEHLRRSREVWDARSDSYGRSERDMAPMMDDAVSRLDVGHGDRVIEIGCGPGTNFERLTERVGTDGQVLAFDYSPKMVERARERAIEAGWNHIEVIRADASSVELDPESFDAALASLSMSVVPDATAAARRAYDALVPGGRLVVFDVRPVQSGPLRAFNPLIWRFFRWYANWNRETDVVAALDEVFDDVTVEETYMGGTSYRAVARKAP